MRALTRFVIVCVILAAPLAAAQVVAVNIGPGNQTDPHVDGNLACYTSFADGASEIRYFKFGTSVDQAIPGAVGALDFLSDVSGTMVAFTRIEGSKQSIWAFDTSTSTATELAPDPASLRRGAAIGGGTVVWQELGFSTGTQVISEVLAYDLVSGTSSRVTNDLEIDRDMAVSPNGNVIAWDKCATSSSPCDIWQAVKGASGWAVTQVTATADPEIFPDTNGTLVVYGGIRAASATSADIYWKPVAGGAESQLALVGEQRNPNISGNFIAFEGRDIAAPSPNWDIYLYEVPTGTLTRVTDTPTLSETLNDISLLSNGKVRIVWSRLDTDQNVYATDLDVGPMISITPKDSVSFSKLPLGNSSTASLTITNVGGQSLTVNSLQLVPWGDPQFSISAGGSTPIALGPGQSTVVQVAFDSKRLGWARTILEVGSNDPGRPVLSIGFSAWPY